MIGLVPRRRPTVLALRRDACQSAIIESMGRDGVIAAIAVRMYALDIAGRSYLDAYSGALIVESNSAVADAAMLPGAPYPDISACMPVRGHGKRFGPFVMQAHAARSRSKLR